MRFCLAALLTISGFVIPGPSARVIQNPPQPGSGLIIGRVIDGNTGSPIAGALVRILGRVAGRAGGPSAQAENVMTSPDGRFLFRGLPKAAFSLTVTKAGYMPGAYGRRSPGSIGDQLIELEAGQRMTDATIRVWPYATLTGRVLDENGEPLVNTTVKACLRTVLAGRVKLDFAAPTGSAYTDDRGVYRHSNLEPGEYVVLVASASATVPASVQDAWDKVQRDGGSPNLQREIDATSAVLPSLSGLRTGDFIVGFGRTATGSIGVYRRPAPGELPVTREGLLPVYRTTFYPGVNTLREASIITIKSGEEQTGVDFQLRPVPSVRLSGTVTGPAGPQAHMGLRLLPAGFEEFTNDGGMMNYVTITDAAGLFTFLGVVPGQYMLKAVRRAPSPSVQQAPPAPGLAALPPIPSDPTLWATMPISVGSSNVDGVSVVLAAGLRLSGRVQFDGAAPRPTAERLQRMNLDIEPADGRIGGIHGILGQETPVLGRFDAEGHVSTYGIPGGKYIVTMYGIPEPWAIKSIVAAGRDISTSPLEFNSGDVDDLVITLTDRPTKLSGVVQDAKGQPDAAASVVVFPTDPAARADSGFNARRVQAIRVNGDGSYSITGLPPGDYFVVAIPDDVAGHWSETTVLQGLTSKATRQRIDDAAVVRLNLKTAQVK